MNFDRALNILAGLVVVAGITTVVAHPGSSGVIRAFGESFTGALRAAQGN